MIKQNYKAWNNLKDDRKQRHNNVTLLTHYGILPNPPSTSLKKNKGWNVCKTTINDPVDIKCGSLTPGRHELQ